MLGRDTRHDQHAEPAETTEAVEVLREVWSAQGQSRADLEEEFGARKGCQRMRDVGFDDLAAGASGDIRSAWRATLEREGKLDRRASSVLDLVFGSPEKRSSAE